MEKGKMIVRIQSKVGMSLNGVINPKIFILSYIYLKFKQCP